MEIGTEISKNIRAAIKGKLQELGAYIDEELPDYIMVMVANKKNAAQMADDLSLFLGTNTAKFTTWLQGVLEKLRTVAVEPESFKDQLQSDTNAAAGKGRLSVSEESRAYESKRLTVSSSHLDRTEARISSSAHESRRGAVDKSSSRLTSAVKPLMEALSSEAVIDIKPEIDDDLITEELVETSTNRGRARGSSSRPTAEIYRPGHSKYTSQEELSRKRKAPMASSVVRVSRTLDEDSDDLDEDDSAYGGRGVSSRVSLPSKPERKPTLPPAKQANRNLILKAISEAQDSITKTTSFSTIPQRQTVPVAPRTRPAHRDEMTAAIQLVQEHLHSLAPQAYTPAALPQTRDPGVDGVGVKPKTDDTRSFIMSRPQLQMSPPTTEGLQAKEDVNSAVPRTVQSSKETVNSASPKFIVTLDGVPTQLGNLSDCEMDLDDVRPHMKVTDVPLHMKREPKVGIRHRLLGGATSPEEDMMEAGVMDDGVPLKKQKVLERCKFWPVCKSGDECLYHHPTTQCKTFPNCKFGDKCLFVHPNCKFDARCSKPDCPFTHAGRRSSAAALPRPVLVSTAAQPAKVANVCRFFPECKNVDCQFYHPKPCRFAGMCKRASCTFYHPTTSLPPRHALKWMKSQSR
ncbi:Zinc finger CCCH domain-containing protein 14 [Takifugu flavidus]|uniref:Zinc finger CCCH domain-containing protein 14 n=1 Tax=Takifugu flavidus TaxID=433684 RepID=A0A5C6NPS7_9TELE|nr:Zinc finger CCCH domain-containing protein 14 [Takifugu flavidus]